jgi:protoporphyrinogen oxidase
MTTTSQMPTRRPGRGSAVATRPFAAPPLGSVAVIGGGISGLAAAHFLTEAGARVTLYESSDQFGGLGTFFLHGDTYLDRFYHCILPTDTELLALLGFLGLSDGVYWRETSLGFYYDRTLYRLDGPLDLLRFRPARFLDRVRLGLTALYASYVARPEPLDDMTVEAWLTKLSGRRAFDRLWRPLLEAKFGDAYRQIPALWYWASFNREKGTKQEVKGYLRGGYKGITDALVASLEARGAQLHLRTPVEKLDLATGGRPSLTVGGEAGSRAYTFDRVVCTTPFSFLRTITAGGAVSPWLERIHSDIDYQGVLNVLVILRRPLTKHYWIPVVQSGAPFQGIVETTHIIDSAEVGGRHLVYLLNYVHRTHPLYQRDPATLVKEYVDAMLALVPGVRREDVVDAFLFKAPFVEPLYTPGYGKRKPPEELVPGRVYLATTTQVYPNVTSWNSSTTVARQAVEQLIRHAAAST